MDSKYLLKNEEIITHSDNFVITLTNLRLRYEDSLWGKSHIISILLENISSVEIKYKSRVVFILLAVLSGLAAAFFAGSNAPEELIGTSITVAVVSLLIFFLTRKHFITISSNGGAKIYFHAKGMKQESILNFINQLEEAVKDRQ